MIFKTILFILENQLGNYQDFIIWFYKKFILKKKYLKDCIDYLIFLKAYYHLL